MRRLVHVLTLVSGILSNLVGRAQPSNTHWYFGQGTGISFFTGIPQAVTQSQTTVYEACATLSDEQGNLLFYTNGESVWDRTHAVMPGACAACGTQLDASATTTQGALIVPRPAGAGQYFVFTLDTPSGPNGPAYRGLRYSVVDLALRNGLGDVLPTARNVPVLPAGPGGILTEKLAAVRHRNRRDVWVVVHGMRTNLFYSYLVTAAGVSATPVISQAGTLQTDFGGPMKFSPNGQLLAVNQITVGLELFDFDANTGLITNPRALPSVTAWNYGVEFSPDNSKLYASRLTSVALIRQYDLGAGSLAAIINSAVDLPLQSAPGVNFFGSLELGPDGKIYASHGANATFLGAISRPNQAGVNCAFRENAVSLGNRRSSLGMQNRVCEPPLPTLSITAAAACLGSSTRFAAVLTPTDAQATAHWQFGEPSSGPADSAAGFAPAHQYGQTGSYRVVLRVQLNDGTLLTAHRIVVVSNPPTAVITPFLSELCPGNEITLQLNAQLPGTRYRWSDNSTEPTLTVRAVGIYKVEISDATGCTAQVTAEVRSANCLIPNIITPNNDSQNQAFILKGLNAPDWSLRLYNRWGREIYQQQQYDNTWAATGQPDGVYYYLLTNGKTGQKLKGWLEVRR